MTIDTSPLSFPSSDKGSLCKYPSGEHSTKHTIRWKLWIIRCLHETVKEGHTQKWRLLGTREMGRVMEADRQCQRQEKPEMRDSLLAAAQPFTGSAGLQRPGKRRAD